MTKQEWFVLELTQSTYWRRNLELFCEREPEQAKVVESSIDRLPSIEAIRIGDGQYACRDKDAERPFYDPTDFIKPLESNLVRIRRYYQQGVELVVVAGSGLGYLAAHIEEEICGKLKSGLLLVENRPELVAAQFCLFDCQRLIQSRQVFWAVGKPVFPTLEKVYDKDRLDLVPMNKVGPAQERWLNDVERGEIQRIGAWIAERSKTTRTRIAQTQQAFNERMKAPANLDCGTVWSIATPEAYIHTPLVRSLIQGFKDLGWKTNLLEIRDGFATRHRVNASIAESAPDLVLVCNAAPSSFFSESLPRPRVSWLLDHPRYYSGEAFQQSLTKLDHVFYADRSYGNEFQTDLAASHQFLPVTPSILHKGERTERYAAPIAFVGSYKNAEAFYNSLPPLTAEEVFALLDYLILHTNQNGGDAINEIKPSELTYSIIQKKAFEYTANIHDRLPDAERQINYFLYSLAYSKKREQVVRSLLDLGLVVYGPDSWLPVLGEKRASHYRGWISNDDLPDVYASAEIVLNLHSLQCPTCLNCRDFDVVAAGGCLLADWVEDYDRGYLEPEKDCIVVKNPADFAEQTKRLLESPELRRQLREQGHATYQEKHTPKHRAAEMVEILKGKV